MNSDGIIEAPGIIILFACLLRCLQYLLQSSAINTFKQIRAFWLAAVLVFFAVIRRELNYLPDLLVPTDFMLLSHSYDWWEDVVLTIVYLLIIGLCMALSLGNIKKGASVFVSHRRRLSIIRIYG
ncbi:hypothetical protein [Psychrobacter aquimaris]|uniref:hypothetical protein n=1 Tax=Psychrobacter aquimaris TaxID=292733 RepID=UPI003FD4CFBB